jgi:hypothetical protein
MSKGFDSPLQKAAQAGKIGGGTKKAESAPPTPSTDNPTIAQMHNPTISQLPKPEMKPKNIYMPRELSKWLNVHAAEIEDDASGIVIALLMIYRENRELQQQVQAILETSKQQKAK